MSDFNSSLPVRTENNGDVAVKIVDGTTVSQALAVDASGRLTTKLDDGNGNVVTSQASGAQRALDVGINVSGVQIDPRSIRALTASDIVTAAQGAPGTAANAWFQKITDGVSTAAVKAASTAAAATDPALVVSLSPNSPLPAGTNLLGNVNAIQSGTWTVQPGNTANTTPWLVTDSSDGPVTPGTAAAKSSLAGGQFNTALPTLTTGQQSALQVDSSGRLITAPVTGGSTTVTNFPTTVDTNYGTVGASTIRTASEVGNATGAADFNAGTTGAQTLRVSSNQGTPGTAATAWFDKITDGTNVTAVKAASTAAASTDPSLVVALSPNSPVPAGTNAIGSVLANIQVASAPVSSSNPVPVTISSTIPGTAVQSYNTAASIAAGSTSNHVYTVTTAKTLNLARIWASASGKLKIEIQVETGVATGVFNSKFVGFNSTATPNIDITVVSALQVAAGVRVQIIRTNDDKAAMDVYSTIEGTEV